MQLTWTSARTTGQPFNRWDSFYEWNKKRESNTWAPEILGYQRQPTLIDKQMVFAAELATTNRVSTRMFITRRAGTLAASTQARFHMIWSCSRSRWRTASWMRCQTPAFIHSCSRREQVMPLPHPSSRGRYCHGIPVLRTNSIPVRVARSLIRSRPRFGDLR